MKSRMRAVFVGVLLVAIALVIVGLMNKLRLFVTNGGDNTDLDHADTPGPSTDVPEPLAATLAHGTGYL